MFKLFSTFDGPQLKTTDKTALGIIDAYKLKAEKRHSEYDDLIFAPDKTPEQRRFFVNARENYINFINVGYSTLILNELTRIIPGSDFNKNEFDNEVKPYYEKNINLTFKSIVIVSQMIKSLADNKIIRLGSEKGTPLSVNNNEFLDDGFDYLPHHVDFHKKFEEFHIYGKKVIDEIIKNFTFQNLSPEQTVSYENEKSYLFISLKEIFRASAYGMLLNMDSSENIEKNTRETACMLYGMSYDRFKFISEVVDRLTKQGIVWA